VEAVENKYKQILEGHMLQLTREDRLLIQGIKIYRVVGIFLAFIGISGIGMGMYSIWFRPMTRDSQQITITLILYSIGYIAVGWLLVKICRFLQKIENQVK
jgi:uncharacterized membrane protein YqjE